ncbi:primosomal protein [Rhodococcus sp. X156]|uniref:primosomal protein n=1 Tax=Rhodococcus sp. X156 TaxID=2499145 RepID=UPI000FD86C76|nr:primosomal protein [Rhodococcus sp. X156]
MAQDIVPVELGLTEGDVLTLWAPRWREDGEEWEAFLGHGEHLYCFDEVAELAAFIRTVDEHDLVEHPAWPAVTSLAVAELEPDEDHRYDIVGVPELAAGEPDAWTVNQLDDVLQMVGALAEVCELDKVTEVLDSTDGFAALPAGPTAFLGKDGRKLWDDLGTVLAERWDDVLDALDGLVFVPEVDEEALETARDELLAAQPDDDPEETDDLDVVDEDEEPDADAAHEDGFWENVGIDPITIITSGEELHSLRCYLDDKPLFLGSGGKIDVFTSPRALARFLAEDTDHDMAALSTFEEVQQAAVAGELEITVSDDNTYVLPGIADDIADGPSAVDPAQLELAVELFTDAADAAGDDSVDVALVSSSPLGWFVDFVLRPNPTRLAPSPPFDGEAAAWRELEAGFDDRLRRR